MLHGGFGNIADFKKCIPELSQHFRLILTDAPEQGRSEFPDSSLSYQIMSEYYSIVIDRPVEIGQCFYNWLERWWKCGVASSKLSTR